MKIRKCKFCDVVLDTNNSVQSRWLCCRSCRTIRERMRYPQRRIKILKYQKDCRLRDKLSTIKAYGGKCVCCGEDRYQFLTVEHINKDGAEHKIEIGGSARLHGWLKRNNYPKDMTILCFNCNAASFYYGECPHKKSLLARMSLESLSWKSKEK